MTTSTTIIRLSGFIVLLSTIAAGLGVFWQGHGKSYTFTTLRGETATIHGKGLYKYDTVSIVSQAIAQDVVTLLLGIPVLIISIWLFSKGDVRGHLLLAGTLGYFLYTYTSYAFLAAYNPLFLLYAALFSISLFAFILTMQAFNVNALPARFSEQLPVHFIAGFFIAIGAMLTLMWLGRIVPPLIAGTPPIGLESYTTLVIQVLDLGVMVPVAFISALLLLRKHPWGYLLSAVMCIKSVTMLSAISAMVVGQLIAGVSLSIAEIVMMPGFTVVSIIMTVVLLRNVK